MYYEINIAKRTSKIGEPLYAHYFATAERSITTKERLIEVYAKLKETFPAPEYKIMVTQYSKVGEGIDMKELINSK